MFLLKKKYRVSFLHEGIGKFFFLGFENIADNDNIILMLSFHNFNFMTK